MARSQSLPMFGRIGRIQKNASAPGAYVNQGFGRTGQVGRTFLELYIEKTIVLVKGWSQPPCF